ncbi:photosystem II reaction center protein PsbN [Prochlorococcus sp. AH-716-I19]|nr:photosystem II reaction center protein PsbN [Prochlorococcus sp. AH-716-I19]
MRVYKFKNMVGVTKDPALILLLGSIGLLLFSSIGYGIYTTVGPSSYKLRDTIKEHARLHELGIAHGHNNHNHNESDHLH